MYAQPRPVWHQHDTVVDLPLLLCTGCGRPPLNMQAQVTPMVALTEQRAEVKGTRSPRTFERDVP